MNSMYSYRNFVRIMLAASTCWFGIGMVPAMAAEGISPLQPGATTGSPTGALPPPGVYLMSDTNYEGGKLKNDAGDTAVTPAGQKITASNISSVLALTWVTDTQIWGASYAMAIAQPYKWAETKFTGGTNSVSSSGLVNTAVTPVILSWDLGQGYFISTGLTVYLNDGDFSATYDSSAGRKVKNSRSIGNDYWTFEPHVALTYMQDDWSLTLNNLVDFNTINYTTDYRSGMTYYLDATATKRIQKYTLGVVGNFTKQITDDEIDGVSVPAVSGFYGKGNRAEHILAGPLLGYDFGAFTVTSRLLVSLRAKNDADVSFFHVAISMPIH